MDTTKTDKCLFCRGDNVSAFPSTSNKDEDDERDTDQGQAFATLLKLLTMTSGRDTSIQNDDLSTFWDLVSDKSFIFCQSCLQIMSTLATLQNVLERTIRSIESNLGLIQVSIVSSRSIEGTGVLLDSYVFRREEMLRDKILGSKLLFKTERFEGVYFPKRNSQIAGTLTDNDICGPDEEVEIKVEDFNNYPGDDHIEESENVQFTIFDALNNPLQESLQQDSDAQNEKMPTKGIRFDSGVDDDDLLAENLDLNSPSKVGKTVEDRNSEAYKSGTTGPKRNKRKRVKLKDPANPDDIEDFGETVYSSKRSRARSTLENKLLIEWGLDKLQQPKLILKDCKAFSMSEVSPMQVKKRKSRKQQLRIKKVVNVKEEDASQPQQSLSSSLDIDIDDIKNNVRRTMKSERRISMEGESGGEESENVQDDSDFDPGADARNSSVDTDCNSSLSDSEFEENEIRSPKTTKLKTEAGSSPAKRKRRRKKNAENGVWQRRRVIIRKGKLFFRNREFEEKNGHLYCCFDKCDFCVPKIEPLKQCSRKMLEHIKTLHLVDLRYQCKQCEMNFSTMEEYNEHVTAEHHDNEFIGNGGILTADSKEECEICMKPVRSAGLEKHRWTHKSDEEKEAWIASGKTDPTENDRKKNIKKKIVRPFQCETCGKLFSDKTRLTAHEVVHVEFSHRKKIICETCGDIFTTKRGFDIHDLRMHKPEGLLAKWIYCKICDKKFLVKTHYNIHMMRCHGVEKIHSCDKCGRRFADKWALKKHFTSHLPDDYRPFKCEYCEEAYRYSNNLTRHIRSRHKDKGYEVPHQIRKYIPLESKPVMTCKQMYPCEICDKYFPMPSRLKKHMIASHSEGGSRKSKKRKPKKNASKKKKVKCESSSSEIDDKTDSNCSDTEGHIVDMKEDEIITGDLESSQDSMETDLIGNELTFLVQEGD